MGISIRILLLGIILFIRMFTGGMMGFYIACLAFPIVGFLAMYVSKYYLQMTIKQKVIVSTSLTM